MDFEKKKENAPCKKFDGHNKDKFSNKMNISSKNPFEDNRSNKTLPFPSSSMADMMKERLESNKELRFSDNEAWNQILKDRYNLKMLKYRNK